MKRRFGLVVTRIAILSLIVIAVLIGRDALLKQLVVNQAQAWLGAKVELGHVRSSFKDQKLFIHELAIADPRDPMTNLVQAESATMNINWDHLLRKRLVVDDATASNVVFAAPRSLSGNISSNRATATVEKIDAPAFAVEFESSNARDEWLDRFEHTADSNKPINLKVDQAARDMFSRWRTELQMHRDQVDELKKVLREAHDLVAFDTNPLRNKHLEQAETLLGEITADVRELSNNLAVLDQRVIQDRDLLHTAKLEDERLMVNRSQQQALRGATLSQILLQQDQLRRTEEILAWYFSLRDFVPDPAIDFMSKQTQGRYVPIDKQQSWPGLHIKNMQIDGAGRVAGNSFNFSGTVQNMTSDAAALGLPTTIQLRAQGKAHAFVNCTLDRTKEQYQDTINITCPDLALGPRRLGDQVSLGVTVSPCRTNAEMSLQCVDGELSGSIRFDHSNLVIQIDHLDELAGGEEVAQRINLELASISDYRVASTISGTVDKPFVEINSNLGDRLATKFNEILSRESFTAEKLIRRSYESSLAKINTEVSEEIRRIAQELQDEVIQQQTQVANELNHRLNGDSLNRKLIR